MVLTAAALLSATAFLPARAQAPTTSLSTSPAGPAFVRDSLDAYIRRGLKAWQIPGLAIAIVKDGKVVVSKGYGVREVGKAEPVDGKTLFYIASNTKLFTGTAISALVESKQLSLDDRVTKYLPDFRLYDSTSTRLCTVRDLLCHRLGTKTFQGDFTFWNSDLSRGEVVRKMRLLKPDHEFRQEYGYCNSAFTAAGEIIARVSGQPWEEHIMTEYLRPLGMTNTAALTAGIEVRQNLARPYTTGQGKLEKLPYDRVDALAPAASIVSCVEDMSKWLRFQLDSGRTADGKSLVPWAVLQRTRDANTLVSSRRNPRRPMHFQAYGLGIYTADYNGRQIYWHTGGADGFVSGTCFVPEVGLGIVILTNQDNQGFFEALRYQLLDAYLGVPYVNRSQQALAPTRAAEATEARQRAALSEAVAKARDPKPLPRSLSAYAGTYQHPLMGAITLVAEANKRDLKITFPHLPGLTATLEWMQGEEWLLTYSNPAYGRFPATFTGAGEKVSSLTLKVNDFLEYDPYTFAKR
ncbi:MAG: serine hydrolase [Hymenobacteraceae bacterium]|nr:serine hydrolase [Hymenobacteraceae bacterium]